MIKGKIAFYCDVLDVTRQGFYWYLKHRDDPWKYEDIAEKMRVIADEDECNDTYGRCRMNQALKLKYPNEDVPSERTVYRIMERIGLSHRPNRKPHGITKADRNARKSENLLNRDFRAGSPLKKCVTDITEIPAKNGKLYVSAIFDCYDLGVLGLSMSDNMKTELCTSTIENMVKSNPSVCGMILHSDRGSQYTSASYRAELSRHGIIQSMNSDGGRCHDNARCEAMWARMKEELLYGRYDTKQMTIEELKTLIWRYCMVALISLYEVNGRRFEDDTKKRYPL